MEEYEIDLRDLFVKLWRGKYVIIIVFLIAILLASFYSFVFLDPVYESRAALRVRPLPQQIATELTWEVQVNQQGFFPLNETISVDIVTLTRHGYSQFFSHQRVMNSLQEKVESELGRELSINRLLNSLEREINTEDSLLYVFFRDNDPQDAREILTAWVEVYKKELVSQLFGENQRVLEKKEQEMQKAFNHYNEVRENQKIFLNEFPFSQMKARLGELQKAFSNHLNELQKTRIELGYYEETSKYLDSSARQEEENLEQIILGLEEELQGQYLQNLKQLAIQLEEISPVLVHLRQEGIDHKVQLEGLKSRKVSLEQLLEEVNREISSLSEELRELETKQKHLERQYESAWKNMIRAEERHHSLSFFLENFSDPGITVFEEPTLRTGRVAPNHRLNLALAGVLGLFLGTGGLLFYYFMRGDDQEK